MFSDRFEVLCTWLGVRPGRACMEMGVSRSLASKWKTTGTERPSAEVLEKMSEYFGLSIEQILSDELPKAGAQEALGLDDFSYALFNESRELSEEKRQMLLNMARYLRQEEEKGT